MEMKKEFIVSFLQGMFDGDGCFYKNGKRVFYTTTSEKLSNQLQILLLNFGIISSRYNFLNKPSQKIKVESLRYVVEMSRFWGKKFLEEIGFRTPKKQGEIQVKYKNKTEDLFYRKITEESFSEGYCYDFVIPDTKQYFANGFIVHNTPDGKYNVYGKINTNHPDYSHLDIEKIRLHWREHPEKTQEWYDGELRRRTPEDVARELD
ncbi:MAG: hypothetical protein EOM76_13030, partial [Sphingobacteriia bacterium]|nr:hypothetical protein [Sphingobacteriia bacterium]